MRRFSSVNLNSACPRLMKEDSKGRSISSDSRLPGVVRVVGERTTPRIRREVLFKSQAVSARRAHENEPLSHRLVPYTGKLISSVRRVKISKRRSPNYEIRSLYIRKSPELAEERQFGGKLPLPVSVFCSVVFSFLFRRSLVFIHSLNQARLFANV